MIYYLLVTIWYSCALPQEPAPCLGARVEAFADAEDVLRAYLDADGAKSRQVFKVRAVDEADPVIEEVQGLIHGRVEDDRVDTAKIMSDAILRLPPLTIPANAFQVPGKP